MSILASNNVKEIKNELIKDNLNQTPLEEAISNLYMILLQYYTLLIKNNHPKITLITDVLDLLIDLKKNPPSNNRLKEDFDIIHKKAYNNIETIYDYDKENNKDNLGYLSETSENKSECLEISNHNTVATN